MRAVLAAAAVSLAATGMTWADDFPCVSTTFNLLSPNDKVCVSDFDDPDVPGVTCFISQARTGGWGQPFGLNEDPSNFSVSCRQSGPITADISKLPAKEEAFTEKTSIFFKRTRIYRIPDVKRNAIHLSCRQFEAHQRFAGQRDQRRTDHGLAQVTRSVTLKLSRSV